MQRTLKQSIDGEYKEITTIDGSSDDEICENALEALVDESYVEEEELEDLEWKRARNSLFVLTAYTYEGEKKTFVLE